MVPFQRNGDLIGRETYIQNLATKLRVPNNYCRIALVGLGGIGYVSCSTSLESLFSTRLLWFTLLITTTSGKRESRLNTPPNTKTLIRCLFFGSTQAQQIVWKTLTKKSLNKPDLSEQ